MSNTATPAALISSERVKGTKVVNRSGESLGEIDSIMIEKRSGKASYAVMSFGGFLGIGEQYHPVPWDALDYDPGEDAYVVPMDKAQLEGAPYYAPGEEPDWNDRTYNEKVYKYYGYPYPFI